MQLIREIHGVRSLVSSWRANKELIGFVPTMGNLHSGHLQLVEQAKQHVKRVVVSIYVNPLQFGGSNDFDTYPRTFELDKQKLEEVGTDMLFAPSSEEMYPRTMEAATKVQVPVLSDILCGEFRPGHFTGVATVVNKFLNIVQPDILYLGEKDYQQLLVVRQMVEDLAMNVQVEGVATVRETGGLAMSSRNQYLDEKQRSQAAQLIKTLEDVKSRAIDTNLAFSDLENEALASLKATGFDPEYVRICDAETLQPAIKSTTHKIVLAAAWLGKARLIDNLFID